MSRSKLRVAMIAPPWLSIPPKAYGGIELVIAGLVQGLRKQGVEVELFTVASTRLRGVRTHSLYPSAQWQYHERPHYESTPLGAAHVEYALQRIAKLGRFDIIHDHNVYHGPVILSWATKVAGMPPALHTFHGPPFTVRKESGKVDNRNFWQQMGASSRLYYVGISEAQTHDAPQELSRQILPAVHHGVDLSDFPFEPNKRDTFITLARFTHDKGQHNAVRYCNAHGYKLKMAGTVAGITSARQLMLELANPTSPYRGQEDFRYFSDEVLPVLFRNPNIQYLGNIGGKRKLQFIGRAKALLAPIEWEEPFGVAVIEALACGTPVVAMKRGAMPEIIEHGVTGFLAENEKEFQEYMDLVGEIDPAACRRSVEQRFSIETMTQNYLDRYRTVLKRAGSTAG